MVSQWGKLKELTYLKKPNNYNSISVSQIHNVLNNSIFGNLFFKSNIISKHKSIRNWFGLLSFFYHHRKNTEYNVETIIR